MRDSEKAKFLKMMQATLAIYDKTATTETVGLWWNLLAGYEFADVERAFAQYLKCAEGRFAPKPASIIAIIDSMHPDGRPGADEAWAMIPMDEYASAVMTQEMAEALSIARPLLESGDKIAARMAFKEAYSRIVDANKRNGIRPSWFPSLGQDKEGRDAALSDAVRLGRLSADHAIGLLPPEKIAPMLQSAGKERLALDYKLPSAEESMARIQSMKDALKQREAA
ncbi:MAG: replicative helicase loader/inhibitor [Gallionella sp.]|nr:replicative helicase loader/inhibitor [Gallionella sp.]